MGNLRVNFFAGVFAILLFPGHDCCFSQRSPSKEEKCPENQYLNVFTQNCTDFNQTYNEVQGDCPETNMHLELIPNTKTVRCACNVRGVDVPLIYVAQKRKCYELFDQGPCNDDNIITINGQRPGCVPDPCLELAGSIVVFKGECYQIGDPCEESGQIGRIVYKAGFPVCYKSTSSKQCIRPDDGKCPTSTYFYYGQCLQESLEGLD